MTANANLDRPKHDLDSAAPEASAVLETARAEVGVVPNIHAGMASSPGLLETYLDGPVRFRAKSGLTAREQEIAFLTISEVNGCGDCMAAHSMVEGKQSCVCADVLDAIREGCEIPDARLAALFRFTRMMVENRGLPAQSDVGAFRAAEYTDRQALEIVSAIGVKTFSNYANHLMHTEVDPVFADPALEPAE